MPRKFTDAERAAVTNMATEGAVVFATVIKLAFNQIAEADARPLLTTQVGAFVDSVEKFAEIIVE